MSGTLGVSKNFPLSVLSRSTVATRNGWSNDPPPEARKNLERLATEVLEPIQEAIGRPIYVTSGYRSLTVNRAVGGSLKSAHMDGRAADFVVPGLGLADYAPIVRAACESLPVGKLIQEFSQWMHVQIEPLGVVPRRQWLLAENKEGKTVYSVWG